MDRTFLAAMLLAGFSTYAALPSEAAAQQAEPPQVGHLAPGGMPPGFEAAAASLGVEADVLFAAMTEAGGPQADLSAVAAKLGIDEAALREALPPPPERP